VDGTDFIASPFEPAGYDSLDMRVGFDARWYNDSGGGAHVAALLPLADMETERDLLSAALDCVAAAQQQKCIAKVKANRASPIPAKTDFLAFGLPLVALATLVATTLYSDRRRRHLPSRHKKHA
jgi:hypothetical protein